MDHFPISLNRTCSLVIIYVNIITALYFAFAKERTPQSNKNQSYSIGAIKKILDQLKKNIVHSILFLRHIKKFRFI